MIEILPWSPDWSAKFSRKAATIRSALGATALRIDHIGSTSVDGLPAKPIIDIQMSVADFEPIETLVELMQTAGYIWRQSNGDLSKRYFREQLSEERTHVHICRAGSWHEQWALLFRDYMRQHSHEHIPYAALKLALAEKYPTDRPEYTEGKADHLWSVIRRADQWAADTDWRLGPTDA
ncbi:GrpB family protein [Rhizobium leguminosarum]|uniref:GrpB family protein n=1 Tax=Rhizobium leguminosarum TaxID=384 RepID=UPI0010310D24|nr:GrpB family protein [Rhizobium leguminosarum]TBG96054.1 GrpB family protein [Rhizobium leguminosarum]